MVRPRSPELARSGRTPLDPDSIATRRQADDDPGTSGRPGPVPEANRAGHHPDVEQDQPDLDRFAERLGTAPPPTGDDSGTDDEGTGDGGGMDRRIAQLVSRTAPVRGEELGRAAGWSVRMVVGAGVSATRLAGRTVAVGVGAVRMVRSRAPMGRDRDEG